MKPPARQDVDFAKPYHVSWHDPGDGWLKLQRVVDLAQLSEDVFESEDLELEYISPT